MESISNQGLGGLLLNFRLLLSLHSRIPANEALRELSFRYNFWPRVMFAGAGSARGKRRNLCSAAELAAAIILVLLAGVAIWVTHAIFQREPLFSKDHTGILVMRMEGDDAFNSLQGDLVDNLDVELQNDPTGKKIEVHGVRSFMPGRS